MKKIVVLIIIILTFFVQFGFAEEFAEEKEGLIHQLDFAEEKESLVYEFPEMKPEVQLWAGYRIVNYDEGSERVGQYEYFDDSFSFTGLLWIFPFPHRIFLEADVLNKEDYFGDLRYAYSDIILFRSVTRSVYHNLENITLVDLDDSNSVYEVDIRDADYKYGVSTDISKNFLRIKTPDFPFHLYAETWSVNRKGTEQQIYMGGSGYYNNRISVKREVDWKTEEYTVGTNSHLGPVEIDFSHTDSNFDPGEDYILNEAGNEQNRIPELEGSSNTLKLHTNYTSRLIGTATISTINRENNFSGAKAEYFVGHAELLWMPKTKLTFITKYKRQETNVDNPDSITDPSYTSSSLAVKPSISSIIDQITETIRYKPFRGFTLKGEYTHKEKDRKNADEWSLPTLTTYDIYTLSTYSKISKHTKLTVKYIYQNINQKEDTIISDDISDIEPEHSNQGIVSLSWTPLHWLSAFLRYDKTEDTTHNLQILDTSDGNHFRESLEDSLCGSITFCLREDISLTPTYTYMHTKINQDLVYSGTSYEIVDEAVENTDKAHNYALNLSYRPKDNLSLSATIDYTKSYGMFYSTDATATESVSIASFSEVEVEELTYSLEGTYEFKNGWGLGLEYSYTDLEDDSYDGSESGDYHSTLMMLSKKW